MSSYTDKKRLMLSEVANIMERRIAESVKYDSEGERIERSLYQHAEDIQIMEVTLRRKKKSILSSLFRDLQSGMRDVVIDAVVKVFTSLEDLHPSLHHIIQNMLNKSILYTLTNMSDERISRIKQRLETSVYDKGENVWVHIVKTCFITSFSNRLTAWIQENVIEIRDSKNASQELREAMSSFTRRRAIHLIEWSMEKINLMLEALMHFPEEDAIAVVREYTKKIGEYIKEDIPKEVHAEFDVMWRKVWEEQEAVIKEIVTWIHKALRKLAVEIENSTQNLKKELIDRFGNWGAVETNITEWVDELINVLDNAERSIYKAAGLYEVAADSRKVIKSLNFSAEVIQNYLNNLQQDNTKKIIANFLLRNALSYTDLKIWDITQYLDEKKRKTLDLIAQVQSKPKRKRSEIGASILSELRGIGKDFVTYGERRLSIDDAVGIAKEELRQIFNGAAIICAEEGREIENREEIQDAIAEFTEALESMLSNWLAGIWNTLVAKIKISTATANLLKNDILSNIKVLYGNLLDAAETATTTRSRITAYQVRNIIREYLLTQIGKHIEISSKETLDAIYESLTGLDILAGRVFNAFNEFYSEFISPPLTIFYISTLLDDFFLMGTEMDTNPNSCFWSPSLAYAIPSVIVATNVAVAFVFVTKQGKFIEELGLQPGQVVAVNTSKFTDLHKIGNLVLRCLIYVNWNGDLSWYHKGNTYGAWAEKAADLFDDFFSKHFEGKKIKLKESEWICDKPPQ